MATPTLHPHPFSTLPLIDLRHLSQPDLTSLSTTQTPLFDHIIIPQIDRSNFNESAGSRKQTYSRQRLAPNPTSSSTTSVGRRRGCSTHAPPFSATNPSEDESENKKIVSVLRDLFYKSGSHIVLHAKKRKAVGAAGNGDEVFYDEMKGGGLGENVVMEIVNRNGCVVDIKGLMSVEDPYKVELEKRTEGLESEEELLGYLRGLKGVWGSRRMKRKVVDAGNFGDWLPVGWKLLLSLKRREGKVWMYCRRYIR